MPDIKVPEGMLNAVTNSRIMIPGMHAPWAEEICLQILEVALRWQRENPPVPSLEQWASCLEDYTYGMVTEKMGAVAASEWVRRMYDASEPEVPEAIKDLLLPNIESGYFKPEIVNERMAECYRRGLGSARQAQTQTQKSTLPDEYHPYSPNPNNVGCAVCGEAESFHKHWSKP